MVKKTIIEQLFMLCHLIINWLNYGKFSMAKLVPGAAQQRRNRPRPPPARPAASSPAIRSAAWVRGQHQGCSPLVVRQETMGNCGKPWWETVGGNRGGKRWDWLVKMGLEATWRPPTQVAKLKGLGTKVLWRNANMAVEWK